ncbi:LOW QUALITY PROTEIN: hypothetical protein CKAN_00552600 [Cinnamomum micranthum f. kanehirae]|uniref:Uncharacterized protein n=1 Tax=Cinnamomum micranthum f. kanehirae TaxID=337451 RepID=A0A3S3MC26_9MAGN|nr:LOW QUALITY PROTEIN: hypothetical protein CKAN_00552600 [Cinnamomum micranthum f. kanehirae]
MYVTRPLSLYRRFPEAALEPPPEGPNSGYLVLFDGESEAEATNCWGLTKDRRVWDLPFSQNKIMAVRDANDDEDNEKKVVFIPVINEPLSSNRYYVIVAHGKYKGHACTCSREEDMDICCLCSYVDDVKPRALNPMDPYQQLQINRRHRGRFNAKSRAPNGIPPRFLRRKEWRAKASTPNDWGLGEAHGLNVSLRMRLPEFNFPISNRRSSEVVVGRWYCPFMFIKEINSLKEQMKKSIFYVMTLEQWWEEIQMCENDGSRGNVVEVNATLQRQSVGLFGEEAMQEDTHMVDGMMWFRSLSDMGVGRVGLNWAIVERMIWEEAKGGGKLGWKEMIERAEEFHRSGWKKFGCYVLVERFALRRLDGSLVLTYDFRHTHRIQSKWE